MFLTSYIYIDCIITHLYGFLLIKMWVLGLSTWHVCHMYIGHVFVSSTKWLYDFDINYINMELH